MRNFRENMLRMARQRATGGADILPRAPVAFDPLELSPLERMRARLGLSDVPTGPTGGLVSPGRLEGSESRLRQTLGGAVRGLASALEPLQLPQDAMFAVIAGALDPNTTITERLRRMDLKDYLPGGEAPERPASGEEIFNLLGFDETTAKWAGIAADVAVDPLVFGSWLRVGGKLANVDSLVRLGDRFDHFISPIGVAREVNQVLRRSKTISAWQDARTARVLEAIRNPESVVFGIQRFGEKATRVAQAVLPRDVMLQLTLGRESGLEILKAEQLARASGQRLTREALTMVQNAKYGPQGDTSKAVVQSLIKTMEGQSGALEGLMRVVKDPLERDFIEAATYTLAARQAGDTQVRLSFLTEVAPEEIADVALRELSESLRAALGQFDEYGHLDDLAERLIDTTRAAVEPDRVAIRERLRQLVEARGRKLGLSEDDLIAEQRRVVSAFDDYLRETVTIDAKLGLELSGYPFVSNMLRGRVFELTGDFQLADRLFKRILAVGMTEGEAGLARLRQESTGIRLDDVVDAITPEAEKRLTRVMVGMRAADEVIARIRQAEEGFEVQRVARRAARAAEDEALKAQRAQFGRVVKGERQYAEERLRTLAQGRRRALLDGQDDLVESARVYVQRFRDMWARLEDYNAPRGSNLRPVKGRLLRGLTAVDELVDRYSRTVAAVVEAPAERLSRRLIGEVIKAESALVRGLTEQARLFDDTIARLGAKPKPVAVRRPVTRVETRADTLPPRYQVRLPKLFYDDHVARGQQAGKVVRETKRHYVVELTKDELDGLSDAARRYADEGGQRGLTVSAQAAARALGSAQPVSREAPPIVRAVRGLAEEAREPSVTPGTLAAVDPDMAEVLFRGSADIYDHLARLRSMADEVRLNVERSLASKTRIAEELETVRAELAGRVQRIRQEVAGHRKRLAARQAEVSAARKAEDAVAREERLRWQAQMAAEAEIEGVKKVGGRAHIRQVVQRAMREQGPVPRPTPSDAMPLNGRNTTKEDIVATRIHNAYRQAREGEQVDIRQVLADDVTFEELLGGIADMQALPLGEYLNGLMNGHLRRAYGLFLEGDDFERYIDRLKTGSIILSNVIDDGDLLGGLKGFEREAGLIREYQNALKSAGGGMVLRRDAIAEYLLSAGVDGRRVNEVLEQLTASATNSEKFHSNIRALRDSIDGYYERARGIERALADQDAALTVRNRALFQEQEMLTRNMREVLGDYAMASMSLVESAGLANRVVSRQRFFEATYKTAVERGLVKPEPFTDRYGAVYRHVTATDGAIGGFGGKYVHPYLYKELQRAAQVKKDLIPPAFTRIRALITGGYLAAPAVLAANFAGGFYQSALMGINPLVMARRMAEVAGDMRAGARGEFSGLLDEVRKNLDLDVTSLMGNADLDDLTRLVRIEAGMGPQGLRGFLDDLAGRYEKFLQRPFGIRWAGLEGFQFTENWFKVAAYKEAKERFLRQGVRGPNGRFVPVSELRAQELAAEVARNVVFDYSTLPTSLNFLKRTGVVLFPGFHYFIAGRTLGAVLQRPGTVAVADRLSEALMNASLPFEEQAMLFLGMPEFLRHDQGVPLPGAVVEREDGSKQVSVIPLAQLVPTTTVWDSVLRGSFVHAGNPWAESLEQLGMWGPLLDIISAVTSGEGADPRFTGRYGHVVFEGGTTGEEQVRHVLRFLYNTMAPSVVRKGITIDYQGRAQGLLPSVYRMFAQHALNLPDDLLAGIYSVEERRTGRPDKTWREGIVSAFLRTPQVIALDGPLAGIRNEMQRERDALNENVAALRRRYNRTRAAGDVATSEELLARMRALTEEFNARWAEYLHFYNNYQRRRVATGGRAP